MTDRLEWTEYRRLLRDRLRQKHSGHPLLEQPHETWTTRQVLRAEWGGVHSHGLDHRRYLELLRPEDATEIAELRVDGGGRIVDWNRAVADLTGVARSDVLGRTYSELIEGLDFLTDEYRDESVRYVNSILGNERANDAEGSNVHANGWVGETRTQSEERASRFFPLPLPVRCGPSMDESDVDGCFVELLVTTDSHELDSSRWELWEWRAEMDGDDDEVRRSRLDHAGTRRQPGWIGGNEFTLRRQMKPRTLEEQCRRRVRELFEAGSPFVSEAALASAGPVAQELRATFVGNSSRRSAVDDEIEPLFRPDEAPPSPIVLTYARELLDIVRQIAGEVSFRPTKGYHFSRDWRSIEATNTVHQRAVGCLRKWASIQEISSKGALCWKIARPSLPEDRATQRGMAELLKHRLLQRFSQFANFQGRCVGRYCHVPASRGTAVVVPSLESPETKALTLKIQALDNPCGRPIYDGEVWEPPIDWATVVIPATLNFFQLQKVIECAMRSSAPRDHYWILKDEGDALQSRELLLDETECYSSGRGDSSSSNRKFFHDGNALRQRVALSGAHVDNIGYLCHDDPDRLREWLSRDSGDLSCCDYHYSISAALFRTGMSIVLQNEGGTKYGQRFRITLTKIETVEPTANKHPKRNAFLSQCLRLKGKGSDSKEAVGWANQSLKYKRKCLRREFSNEESFSFPWCRIGDLREENGLTPRAFEVIGVDTRPVAICGEPPCPSRTEKFRSYMAMAVPEDDINKCFQYKGLYESSPYSTDSESEKDDDALVALASKKRKKVKASPQLKNKPKKSAK